MPLDYCEITGRIILEASEELAAFLLSLTPDERLDVLSLQDLIRLAYRVEPSMVPTAETVLGLLGDQPSVRLLNAHDPDRIQELETGYGTIRWNPGRSMLRFWIYDPGSMGWDEFEDFLARLNSGYPEIPQAYAEPLFRPAASFKPSSAQSDTVHQGYLTPAPRGINAFAPWKKGFVGSTVRLANVDYTWNLDHEDLTAHTVAKGVTAPIPPGVNYFPVPSDCQLHGTNALGVVAAVDNDVGVVGIAPKIGGLQVASRFQPIAGMGDTQGAVAAAIYDLWSAGAMGAGDVLLLEVETISGHPVEMVPDVWEAICQVVEKGIVVIEPAGNGGWNLDLDPAGVSGWPAPGGSIPSYPSPKDPRDDSGAILVGAAAVPSSFPPGFEGYQRFTDDPFPSNHGTQVKCFAWGESVFTTGKSAVMECDTGYSSDFGHTSAASAIIAGAAILVQDMARSALGAPLDSRAMRDLLADPNLGTPSVDPIGVMPDLGKICDHLRAGADLYVRDSLSDDGSVPSSMVSMSPDIFVLRDSPPPPGNSYDEASGTATTYIPNATVAPDDQNYVYVRMRNRGSEDATAEARIYWSEPATLISPDQWRLIEPANSPASVLVPKDDSLVVYGPVQWNASSPANRPSGKHACFLAMADAPEDEGPDPASISTLDDFRDFVGAHNNLAWRNFNLETLADGPPGVDPFEEAFFAFSGFQGEEEGFKPEKSGMEAEPHSYDFEFLNTLPEGFRLWLNMPVEMRPLLRFLQWEPQDVNVGENRVELELPPGKNRAWCVRLGPERYRCRFRLESPESIPSGGYDVYVRQIWNRSEVGRITWRVLAQPGEGRNV